MESAALSPYSIPTKSSTASGSEFSTASIGRGNTLPPARIPGHRGPVRRRVLASDLFATFRKNLQECQYHHVSLTTPCRSGLQELAIGRKSQVDDKSRCCKVGYLHLNVPLLQFQVVKCYVPLDQTSALIQAPAL